MRRSRKAAKVGDEVRKKRIAKMKKSLKARRGRPCKGKVEPCRRLGMEKESGCGCPPAGEKQDVKSLTMGEDDSAIILGSDGDVHLVMQVSFAPDEKLNETQWLAGGLGLLISAHPQYARALARWAYDEARDEIQVRPELMNSFLREMREKLMQIKDTLDPASVLRQKLEESLERELGD